MSRASIVVVGGGISGLAAAWELSGAQRGPDDSTPRIEVIEASARVGGSLATTTFAGRTIDLGADGFLARRPEAVSLVEELALSDELEAIGAHGAYLFARGGLQALPEGLVLGVPTDPESLKHFGGLSWRGRLAIRRDLVAPKRLRVEDDATIGEIVRAKLGREVSHQLVEPMIGGIQAGRIDELSAKSVFPALLEAARQGGSLTRALRREGPVNPGPHAPIIADAPTFYTLKNGVGSLPVALVERLEERGVLLRRGVAVTALRRTPAGSYPWEIDTMRTTTPANAVVMAVPAPTVGSLLGSYDQALDDLRAITSAGAAMITFSLAHDAVTLPPMGTGVLVPLGTGWPGPGSLMTTAVTFLDRKWPHLVRPNDVVLRAHVGRIDDARWFELSDDEITRRVGDELAFLLPRFGQALETMVQRWPGGLPQYAVGHELLVRRARAAAAPMAVTLAGNAYDGVGVPASIGSGRRAASQVLEFAPR